MSLDIKNDPPQVFVPVKTSIEERVSTRSVTSAQEGVGTLMGHACQLLQAMQKQHESTAPEEVKQIYQEAIDNLRNTTEAVKNNVLYLDHKDGILTEKGVKNLKKDIKEAEALYIHFIANTQTKALGALAKHYHQNVRQDIVEKYAKGGMRAKWIYLLSWVIPTHWTAVNTFRTAYAHMNKASRQDIPLDQSKLTEVDQNRWREFGFYQKGYSTLSYRAGVIGLDGIYRVCNFFSKKAVAKQLKSFRMQVLSDQERTTIKNDVSIPASDGQSMIVTNKLVPLNKEFDQHIGLKGIITNVFTNIFGSKGISSMNRREGHLVNAWETSLKTPDQTDAQGKVTEEGKTLFRALRHAITSDILGSGKVRHENSRKAAEELLKAALLQELADQGLTLEQAAAKEGGIQLRLNSVSLVTPDDIRTLGSKTNNEKRMLLDQMAALHSFEGKGKSLTLDGVTIPIQFKANTFNFGVNAGAVGKLKVGLGKHKVDASFIKMGLKLQYEHNKEAWEDLKTQVEDFKKSSLVPLYLDKTDKAYQCLEDLKIDYDNLILLQQDIDTLMQDQEAYLEGDNQYEIGAKILNLTNTMDVMVKRINLDKPSSTKCESGYKCAFNCKSGKDRTGFMDCVAKTNAIMAKQNGGQYIPHAAFLGDGDKAKANRKQFIDILVPLLLKSGSLEVTKTNTGVIGYKIQEEARLFGMSLQELLEAQGLSVLTAG